MQPDLTRLRPMSLGDMLDTMFRLYRQNFLTFIGIVALLMVPMLLLQITMTMLVGRDVGTDMLSLGMELPEFDPQFDSFGDLPIANVINYIVATLALSFVEGILILQLVNGALANAVSQSYLDRPVGMLEAYNLGRGRIVNLILAGVLVFLITLALYILPIGLFLGFIFLMSAAVGGSLDGAGGGVVLALLLILVMVVGFLAIILLAILVNMVFLFVTQAVVLEGRGPFGALARSWRLVFRSFWRILGTYLLLSLLVLVLTFVPTYAINTAISIFVSDPADFALQQSLALLSAYVVQILVQPINLITFTLLYYDTRVRKEGYDLHMLAQQHEASADPSPA